MYLFHRKHLFCRCIHSWQVNLFRFTCRRLPARLPEDDICCDIKKQHRQSNNNVKRSQVTQRICILNLLHCLYKWIMKAIKRFASFFIGKRLSPVLSNNPLPGMKGLQIKSRRKREEKSDTHKRSCWANMLRAHQDSSGEKWICHSKCLPFIWKPHQTKYCGYFIWIFIIMIRLHPLNTKLVLWRRHQHVSPFQW